jgi:hypothetical protein
MTMFAMISLDPSHPVNHAQPPTLRCSHCREVFEPPFEQFFYRDRNGPFGWRKWCKACYADAPSIKARRRYERRGRPTNLQRDTAKPLLTQDALGFAMAAWSGDASSVPRGVDSSRGGEA